MTIIRGIVLALAAVTLSATGTNAQQGPQNPPVEVANPRVERIVDYDIYTGRFEAAERVEIRARVSGYLDTVTFEDGDLVEEGALLFEIDPRPFEAVVRRAEAAVESAKATRTLAEIEFERAEQLAERNVGTVQDVDRTRAALTEAEAQVRVAEAELAQAELDLGFTRIEAPFPGRISSTEVDAGNLVIGGASQPTLLATIVRIDPIYFSFTASEADFLRYARLVNSGERPSPRNDAYPVSVRLMDEDDFLHEGDLDFVNNEIDPNSGTISVRAVLSSPQTYIVPGLFGRIRVPASTEYEALLIPDTAILSDQARKIVMLVDGEGNVSPRPVVPGALYRGLRVVRGGLSPDDRVVVNGVQRARPGSTVTPEMTEISFPDESRDGSAPESGEEPEGGAEEAQVEAEAGESGTAPENN